MDASSTLPKGERRVDKDEGVVRSGCLDRGYLTRTVVSSGPRK